MWHKRVSNENFFKSFAMLPKFRVEHWMKLIRVLSTNIIMSLVLITIVPQNFNTYDCLFRKAIDSGTKLAGRE